MQVLGEVRSPDVPASADQRVTFHGVTWKDYELMLLVRGESSVPRLTYLRGTLEVMSPSIHHEYVKTTMARLIEAWAFRRGLRLNGYGSWTVRRESAERGLEPDECYILGPERKEQPDLAIEVVWTSGGIDKLRVYAGLGVREVWFWEEGGIDVWLLEGDQYVKKGRSELLPDLDLEQLAHFSIATDQFDAMTGFLAATS